MLFTALLGLAACEAEPSPAPAVEADIAVDRLAPLRQASLVVVGRVVRSERAVEQVLEEGRPEERSIIIADVELTRRLRGDAPARVRVQMRDASDSAPLVEGRELLLSLAPRPDGVFRVAGSYRVRDGEVRVLGLDVDALASELEVAHAR